MSNSPIVGKPLIVLNQEQISRVEELASVLTKSQIADYMGICANTFRAIEDRQPEVARAFNTGKAQAIANVAANLIAQAEAGNVAAAMFYLRTQAGWTDQTAVKLSPIVDKIEIIRAIQSQR